MKKCGKCGKSKPRTEFGKNQRYCRKCKHDYYIVTRNKRLAQTKASKERTRLMSRYGLSAEAAVEFRARNGGMCELCNQRPGVHIDHDHITGRLRGHLCSQCNTGLGMLGDTLEGVLRAARYLEA